MAMKKVNTSSTNTVNISAVLSRNKAMLTAAMAYNLKKYLKFTKNRSESVTRSVEKHGLDLFAQIRFFLRLNQSFKF